MALSMALAPVGALAAADGCRQLAPHLRHRPSEAQWRQVEGMEVVGWLTEVDGSPVKEGVALGMIQAAPARVFAVVTDNARFAEFMPYVEQSTVEQQPDGTLVNTQRLDLPWPISDRVYKIALVNTAAAAAEAPVWSSAWTHVKGFGNIEESRGAWRIFACGEAALVEYRVLTDPGGQIPTYFKNQATGRSLRRLIEAVRERVAGPSYGPQG